MRELRALKIARVEDAKYELQWLSRQKELLEQRIALVSDKLNAAAADLKACDP